MDWEQHVIEDLRRQIEELREEVTALKSDRDKVLGMSALAKNSVKVLFALGGIGLLDVITKVVHWFAGKHQ